MPGRSDFTGGLLSHSQSCDALYTGWPRSSKGHQHKVSGSRGQEAASSWQRAAMGRPGFDFYAFSTGSIFRSDGIRDRTRNKS